MSVISHILYFAANHYLLTWMGAGLVLVMLVVTSISIKTKKASLPAVFRMGCNLMGVSSVPLFFLLIIPGGLTNLVNAPFLYHLGTDGTAVITRVEVTNSYLNESPIREFQVVLKTAKGEDVKTEFSTVSATYYPMSNQIYIPPTGETFKVRYIPGAPHNFVMLKPGEGSKEALASQCLESAGRIAQTTIQWNSSPANPSFIDEHRQALSQGIIDCESSNPTWAQQYGLQLDALMR